MQENVGIVEFNSSARVVQSLTNNYQRCRRAIGESSLLYWETAHAAAERASYNNTEKVIRIIITTDALKAGGTTAMFDGLMNALKEIVTNGKIFVVIWLYLFKKSKITS